MTDFIDKIIRRSKSEADSTPKWNKPPRSWNRYGYGFLIAARHHTMLRDENRIAKFGEAILEAVHQGDTVADLGAGTGILSMIAAKKAKKVYSVEFFPYLYEFGKEIVSRYGFAEKIAYMLEDARTVTLPEKVDVIICEMIHTGCISENQVPVMNHAIKELLKPRGRAVPTLITTDSQLINTKYTFGGYDFKLPHYESEVERKWETALSPEKTIKTFDLTRINSLSASGKTTVKITQEGIINSLKITSKVYLTKSKVVTYEDMTSSLEPIIFPLDDRKVVAGNEAVIEYYYEPGAGAEGFHYDVTVK